MRLVVYELVSSLFQEIISPARIVQVAAIRPHLFKFGSPTGSLTLQIKDTSGNLIAQSETIAISAIASGAYFHGLVRFLATPALSPSTHYRVYLVPSGGYAFSESGYIGWCNDYDLRIYSATYSPAVGAQAPLRLEVWEQKQFSREAS